MALQKNYTISVLGKDLSFENAYIQITGLKGNKGGLILTITVYDSKEKRNVIRSSSSYQFTPSVKETDPNFIKQGYRFLKTIDEFKDAADVLESGQTS